jgi:hypothetical protein
MLFGVKYHALPTPQLLIHQPTIVLLLAFQRQRIFDNSPTTMCTIRVHRLMQFASTVPPLVDIR